jgi:hypothetical protein
VSGPVDAANSAADAVRELNRATVFPDADGSFEWPSDVDATIGALQTLAQRLPQALTQAGRWLTLAVDAGHVGHDQGRPAADAVQEASEYLMGAADLAGHLAHRLGQARTLTSHLTGLAPGGGQ